VTPYHVSCHASVCFRRDALEGALKYPWTLSGHPLRASLGYCYPPHHLMLVAASPPQLSLGTYDRCLPGVAFLRKL
jgi:hypothetical protein